jgi:multiple sugar transport system ATP-binding protein
VARIEIRQLTKIFRQDHLEPVCALDNLSLSVADKEWLVVAGPSGCGKTTLLRLIAGLEQPSSGEVRMDGESLAQVPPQERNVAMVFQDPALYPHMTVAENISFGLRLRRCSPSEIGRRVGWAAEMLELSECLARKPMQLSGGQRHKVAVARALVRRPQVFLFDEPLGSLDFPTREQIRRQLLKVCRSTGATVIYVTHDQLEAMVVGDTIALLAAGQLQQSGSPTTVYRHPDNLFAARFLGALPINLWEGTLVGDESANFFEAKSWRLQLEQPLAARLRGYSGKPLVLGIRPEEISLAPGGEPALGLEAHVEAVEDLGPDKRVQLRLGSEPLLARFSAACQLPPAGGVRVHLHPKALRFFDPATGKAVA